jgi:hypothetical protein
MSMFWALLRYIDPVQHRQREEALRRQREDWPPDCEPDETDLTPPALQAEASRHRCRVCGYEGGEREFCPTCLAGTMQ